MSYPSAPWHTHGRAFVQPFLVDARELRVPAGFTPITIAGRAVGLLGLVECRPPSPLVYAELVWMPCLVRAAGARGYFVEKMYVDSDASLAGGREIFDATERLVEVWNRPYLEATKPLRELVWPWSLQHPHDDPKRRGRG